MRRLLLEYQGVDEVVVGKIPELVRFQSLAVLVDASAVYKTDIGRHVQLLFVSKSMRCACCADQNPPGHRNIPLLAASISQR
jgi:hypothetical protein